jgi:hypothetical protein
MDHRRIGEISTKMSGLLEQQKGLLKKTFTKFSEEDLHTFAERNQLLRDLCAELMKVS